MRFRPEPTGGGGEPGRLAVLLVNLGTPDRATPSALRRYLAEFLSDPRVVEIPRAVWLPILHGVVLRVRPAKSAAKYRSIWMAEGSPLAVWTARQADALQQALDSGAQRLLVRHAMRYGRPSISAVLDALRGEGATRILILPLYPQYAAATTGSVADAVHRWALGARRVPGLRLVDDYHDDAGYIDALAGSVRRHWQRVEPGERLVLSFHGLPERSRALGDPYHEQCRRSAALLRERLSLPPERVLVTFQSRFGKAKWIEPYTEPTVRALAAQGVRRIDLMCPGFAADCLETLEEIDQEGRAAYLGAGGREFHYLSALNDRPEWIDALRRIALRHLQGWDPPPDAGAASAAPPPAARG